MSLGLCSCVAAALTYAFSRTCGRNADELESALRINQLKDLAQLLNTQYEGLPLIVAVSGRVRPQCKCECKCGHFEETAVLERPLLETECEGLSPLVGSEITIHCESGGEGVIVVEKVEQLFLERDRLISSSVPIFSIRKEVPWCLDDGTGRVRVVGTQAASGFELTLVDRTEVSGQSLLRHLRAMHNRRDGKMLGIERTKLVLPVGSSLTAIGEAVQDADGTIRVQRPRKGRFWVFPGTIDQMIVRKRKEARSLRYVSNGLAVLGACLLFKYAYDTAWIEEDGGKLLS